MSELIAPFIYYFFLKTDGAGVEELMKQPQNCRGHWCTETYKLAGSYGKLPSTFKVLAFINSGLTYEK